jgi:hypothetical protein
MLASAGSALADDVEVTISPDGKKVQISGDANPNDITIEEKGGTVTVKGNGTTKIKGPTTFPRPDELKIRMNGGSDKLKLTGVTVKTLDIKDERNASDDPNKPDSETIELDAVHVGDLKVRLGNGNDEIKNTNNSDAGRVDVKTGGGRDQAETIFTAPLGALPGVLGGGLIYASYDTPKFCAYRVGAPYSLLIGPKVAARERYYTARPAQCVAAPLAFEDQRKEPNACRLEAAASSGSMPF